MTQIQDTLDGLRDTVTAALPDLAVYTTPQGGAPNSLPALMVRNLAAQDVAMSVSRSGQVWQANCLLLARSASDEDGWSILLDYCADTGQLSLKAAVESDPTWGSVVATSRILSILAVGRRVIDEGQYWAADVVIEWVI